MDASAGCAAIHDAFAALPPYKHPSDVPLRDGLYVLYEFGEVSPHGPRGRIVRVGNHPRSVGGLVKRLKNHYRSGRGAKNGSVFRKYLGGALLRRDEPGSECLAPSPGSGHWEKQDAAACEACGPLEDRIGVLLDETFTFRCLSVPDITERNALEVTFVATLAQCPVCAPSADWLGNYCYSAKVRRSGLWNTAGASHAPMSEAGILRLRALIADTVRLLA